MMWNYKQPVEIYFGDKKINEVSSIAKSIGGKKGILISGKSFVRNGVAQRIKDSSEGLISTIFSDISPNPDVKEVDSCAEIMRENGIDFVIALGGGSVLDAAKAASVIALTNDSIRKYHGTSEKVPEKHLPVIAVPTTSGTGSEVTSVSVLSDHESGKKAPIVSDSFYPVYAVIDPELTYSMPPQITAATGIDVLSHAIEGFWSKGHQPICDACAIHAARLVFENLYTAYKEPENREAREKMAEASVIAGLAFTIPKTTSSHACSFPLTNIYGIPHGEACGLTLDYFVRINGKEDDGRILDFAKKLGFKDIDEMADKIHELKLKLNLLTDLKKFNLTDDQINELSHKSLHPNLYNNPVNISEEMLRDMYNAMR